MYTDYINGEERWRVTARKSIYWVAAITCIGGAMDATNAMDAMRAKATAMSRPVAPAAKVDFVPLHGDAAPPAPRVSNAVTALRIAPPVPPTALLRLATADAEFEAALSKLAVQETAGVTIFAQAMPEVVLVPAETPKPVEASEPAEPAKVVASIAPAEAAPFAPPAPVPVARTEAAPPARTAPAAPTSAEPAFSKTTSPAPAEASSAVSVAVKPVEMPAVQLPNLADLPLPRPRPPLTPAQELGLEGKERAQAEKCLSQAIYFEARNEPVRGQVAVAQVVLNRVFSPYYPDTVCGVVFQNAHRFLSCQFTFACDGKSKAVRERGAWARAQRIARQALDAQVWLPDVAKSTHYHATYVRPVWIREMKKMVRHGTHIFYRPHRWGDGADEAGWGVASLTHVSTHKSKAARQN